MYNVFASPLLIPAIAAIACLLLGFLLGFLAGRCCRKGGSCQVEEGEGVELYVGNLSYDLNEKELSKTFSGCGSVVSARIITNKFNKRSKGYGFVEMASQRDADKAVEVMHGKEIMGRKLVVNEARSRSRD